MERCARAIEPDVVAAYLAGELADDELAELDHHLDACAECRWLVYSAAGDDVSPSRPTDPVLDTVGGTLPTGTLVGRYRVQHPIGAGGMGVVYAATDRELGRSVALKAVRQVEPPGGARNRVVLEAQAMARVAHPNVISVYEIVEHGGRLYVAMERVDGATMAAWLSGSRTVAEIVGVFAAASEGLAAVHGAGLVHGDVKPSNILVGSDGRVRITDFGLASTTGIGAVAELRGTPGFIAPELLQGAPASAASDQFALCRSLQGALAHARGRVPRRLRAAIARGLAADPAHRHASIEALLVELRHTTRRRRLHLVALGAGLALAAVGALALHRHADARAELATCVADEQVWDDDARARVERALRASGARHADSTWQGVDHAMSAWSRAHHDERAAACAATLVEATQGRAELDTRRACLADHLRRARALVDSLQRSDRETASHALVAVANLPQADACADPVRRPTVRPPEDPSRLAAVDAARDEVARIEALEATGSFGAAAAAAPHALAQAEATEFAPVIAEALYRLGSTQLGTAEAGETLARAAALADAVGDDRLRAHAWITAMRADYELGRGDRLASLRASAESALQRAGGTPLEWAELHHIAGVLHVFRDELDDGERELDLALASSVDAGLAGRMLAARSLVTRSIAHAKRGDLSRARQASERVVAMFEEELGAEHPRLAGAWLTLGQILHAELQLEPARAALERAVALVGDDAQLRAVALDSLAFTKAELGESAAARAMHAASLGIWQGTRPDHPRMVLALLGLGQASLALGDATTARFVLELAYAMPPTSSDTRAEIGFALARALADTGGPPARIDALARDASEQFARPDAARSPRGRREKARLAGWRAQAVHG